MKKGVLLLILGVFSTALFAQKTHIGFKVGAAYSGIRGEYVNDIEGPDFADEDFIQDKFGFAGGIALNTMAGDHFWLKHEFMFVNKGYTVKSADQTTGEEFTETERLYYVDMYPLSLAVHVEGAQFFVGPAASILLGRSRIYQDDGKEVKETGMEEDDYGNPAALIPIDVGLVTGLEYEFPFGLNLGVRYIHSFFPLYEKTIAPEDMADPDAEKTKTQIFNKSFMFTIGFTLGRTGGGGDIL